ncbi:MAG: hypothetical protein PSX79_11265 [bacterium]|nr:hypothetical protein [bacterium]
MAIRQAQIPQQGRVGGQLAPGDGPGMNALVLEQPQGQIQRRMPVAALLDEHRWTA